MTIWIRSLELPPSLTEAQNSPLGLPKSSLRTCPSLVRWLGAPDLQPNHKASPPEVTTGPPPVHDGNSFVTPASARGNQPSPDHTATRGTTSGESPALRPVNNSSVTPASTQGSASVEQTVTSGLPTVQSSARRAFQPARSPHCHTTTMRAPSPTLTAITEPSVTTVTGGNTSNNGLTVAAERILQSRPQSEVTTRPPPVPPAEGDPVAPATTSSPLLQPAPNPEWPPPNPIFLAAIKDALAWHPPLRSKPVFKKKLTELAARTNLEILESYNYDLQAILLEDAHSPLRPGSEFRPTAILDPVLQGHPLWLRAKKTLMHGAHLPVEPIEEEPRLQDLLEAIKFDNHKSATKDGPKLLSIVGKEVEKGWQLTLPISALQHLPGAVIGPFGIVSQNSIDAFGTGSPKTDRSTISRSVLVPVSPLTTE